jgi:hypothetical protein
MAKYKNSKIYCITNDIDSYRYIGSTNTRILNDRLFLHLCYPTKPPSYKHAYANTYPSRSRVTKRGLSGPFSWCVLQNPPKIGGVLPLAYPRSWVVLVWRTGPSFRRYSSSRRFSKLMYCSIVYIKLCIHYLYTAVNYTRHLFKKRRKVDLAHFGAKFGIGTFFLFVFGQKIKCIPKLSNVPVHAY